MFWWSLASCLCHPGTGGAFAVAPGPVAPSLTTLRRQQMVSGGNRKGPQCRASSQTLRRRKLSKWFGRLILAGFPGRLPNMRAMSRVPRMITGLGTPPCLVSSCVQIHGRDQVRGISEMGRQPHVCTDGASRAKVPDHQNQRTPSAPKVPRRSPRTKDANSPKILHPAAAYEQCRLTSPRRRRPASPLREPAAKGLSPKKLVPKIRHEEARIHHPLALSSEEFVEI